MSKDLDRRDFLKGAAAALVVVGIPLATVTALGPTKRHAKDLRVGDRIRWANRIIEKADDGYYTKNAHLYKDRILFGDADMIDAQTRQYDSWMGPMVSIEGCEV